MTSLANASPMPFSLRNCSPVTPIVFTNPRWSSVSPRFFQGNTGSSYICRNLPTVSFISLFVFNGASPYLHNSFALSHQPSSERVTSTNSLPFHIPRSGSSSRVARLSSCEAVDRLKSRVALTRMWFTSTKIDPPSSMGTEGSDQASTVVVRPPM